MLKPLFLTLIGCLGFSGCTTSQTWNTVVQSRADFHSNEADASAAYANKLHRILRDASVEHKVVTYQYHYTTRLREESVGTRTAVLYRDNFDPANPWWLAEEQIARPVWLPGENPETQVAFYIHHPVNIVHEKDFPATGGDRKATVAMARSASGFQYAGASHPIRLRSKASSNYYEMAAALPQSAAQRSYYATLFRSVHGRTYNPSRAGDRRKMAKLQNDASRHRQPLASQTF